jgi:ribosomal protein L12E/L44/L45/RPP1/RPP2
MIRRNPTLIAMSDLDVQDVRAVQAARQAAATAAPAPAPTSVNAHTPQPVVAAEEDRKRREAMTRNQRLGL